MVYISRWNPFAKKYGIFGVIHAHSKRNRVVSKHGKLNTYRKPDENREIQESEGNIEIQKSEGHGDPEIRR